MSEELEKLKSLGAQKIYEDTHIPVLHVQAILYSSFDSLQRVQFLGFISILEREYHVDLSSLKASGTAYFDDLDAQKLDESLVVIPNKRKQKGSTYFVIFIVLVMMVIIYNLGDFNEEGIEEPKVDNVLIQKVQESIKPLEEANTTIDVNSTINVTSTQDIVLEEEELKEVQKLPQSFKIRAKSKVWFGYIDVATNKKNQKTFKGEIDLDPTKKWLLIFGHGYIDMFIDGKKVEINSRDNIRYLYENGSVKAITIDEFKKLNRGSKW
ncbi:MAG: hypothetical protein Q9M34_06100 [Sulfurimonas sp.]|nr:hypothetical protein [Sulfurimonas sp.]